MGKPLVSYTTMITVTASVSTSAYATNDQLGGIQTLTRTGRENQAGSVLHSVTVISSEGQAPELDILFFNQLPDVTSTDNAAINVIDSELRDKCVGFINFSATDYKLINGQSAAIGCVRNVGLVLKPIAGSQDCFAVPILRTAVTFTSSNSLVFKYELLQD